MKTRLVEVDCETITAIIGKPDKECPDCDGTGSVNGLICLCTIKGFNPPVKGKTKIRIPDE